MPTEDTTKRVRLNRADRELLSRLLMSAIETWSQDYVDNPALRRARTLLDLLAD